MKATLLAILFLALSYSYNIQAQSPRIENTQTDNKTINILTNNWTSQIVNSHITGKIFTSIGYSVNYRKSSVNDQWGALAHGSSDIQVEIWEGTMTEPYTRLIKNGSILDAGTHDALTREDWWYPTYVEKLCPELPDWKALKHCAPLFSRPDSNDRGVYFAGPWEKPDEAKVRALGLDFIVKILNSSDEIWVELKRSYNKKQPIVIHNWTPNWVENHYEGRFIEFPKFHPDCETDPSWGVNKAFLYDCGNPKNGWLKKVINTEFAKNDSCAYNTLININFSNNHISEATAYVDVDNLNYIEAADAWMRQHSSLWKSWIAEECLK